MNKQERLQFRLAITILALCPILAYLTGCATQHQAKELDDTNLNVKGHSTYGEIGINDDGQAVIQIKKSAEVELRSQEMANYYFAEKLRDEVFFLHDCRVATSDPANGGSGEVAPIPSVDNLKPVTKVQEELGIVDDSLIVVTKEFLDERLAAERKYQTALEQMIQTVKPLREECQRKLGYTLAAHGVRQ
jgi:hypothetical protein